MPDERLQKILSNAGVASRREAEAMIVAGRVAVNGKVLSRLGSRADPANDIVTLDGEPVIKSAYVYLLLNKPAGVVTSARDERGRKTVLQFAPSEPRVHPVGRLDVDSEGLVILTNDGELTNRLTHPKFEVEKEYLVGVHMPVSKNDQRRMVRGIEDGSERLRAASVRTVDPEGATDLPQAGAWLLVVLRQGRNREIRRMMAALDRRVVHLRRIRLGPLSLGSLAVGRTRQISHDEVAALYQAAKQQPSEPPAVEPAPSDVSTEPSESATVQSGEELDHEKPFQQIAVQPKRGFANQKLPKPTTATPAQSAAEKPTESTIVEPAQSAAAEKPDEPTGAQPSLGLADERPPEPVAVEAARELVDQKRAEPSSDEILQDEVINGLPEPSAAESSPIEGEKRRPEPPAVTKPVVAQNPERVPSVIALDGTAASGKTTLAHKLAQRFGHALLDTGGMYRAFTLAAQRAAIPPGDLGSCRRLARGLDMRIVARGTNAARICLTTEDVTDLLRAPAVEGSVSEYAAIPAVRDRLVALQREFARQHPCVMVGRDIGTVVLPDAEAKIFLMASEEERGKRRNRQSKEWGVSQAETASRADIAGRDTTDSTRTTSPLKPADDAVVIDTTDLSPSEVLAAALEGIGCASV